jgi:homocysteine S-methyltransferase
MSKITLLDGGLGQELIKRCSAPPHPLWSTKVMLDEPHLVADIHRDFVMQVRALSALTPTR